MVLAAIILSALAVGQPPAWIQRAVPTAIVAWAERDVLGTPIVEGIAVDRGPFGVTVNVVDSRFDPPRIVKQRELKGQKVRWLRAGAKDGLSRPQIALDVVDRGKETAYLLRVGRGFNLELVRSVRGTNLKPTLFSS